MTAAEAEAHPLMRLRKFHAAATLCTEDTLALALGCVAHVLSEAEEVRVPVRHPRGRWRGVRVASALARTAWLTSILLESPSDVPSTTIPTPAYNAPFSRGFDMIFLGLGFDRRLQFASANGTLT